MLPQIFISLKFFILALLTAHNTNNPHSCHPVLKNIGDYESCFFKAQFDFNHCQVEQMACLTNCLNFANEANRLSFVDQAINGITKAAVGILAQSCNTLCKKPFNVEAGWHCLDRQRDKEDAWIAMIFFEKDKRTREQKKEDGERFLISLDEREILDHAELDYLLADPNIYLETIPREMTEEEDDCISVRYRAKDEKPCTQKKQDEIWARWSARNNYLSRKECTEQIESMIKYWDSHTDFATKYIHSECTLLSKKNKNQCVRAFVNSLQHLKYLDKRSAVMRQLERRSLQNKAVALRKVQETKTKEKKAIKTPARKPVYFIGHTPKPLHLKQKARSPKNKSQYRLAHR